MPQRSLPYHDAFLRHDRAEWMRLVERDLKGSPFQQRLVTHTYEGIDLQPLYTHDDGPTDGDPAGRSGLPPMTRGPRPLGTARDGWEIRHERAEPDLAALNRSLREDLDGGVQGVLLRFDACARAGRDVTADHGQQLAGVDGAMLYCLADLQAALAGVHLDIVHVGLECGAAFLQGAGLLSAAWERAGIAPDVVRGGFHADPLGVLAREGELPYSLQEGLGRVGELTCWTAARYTDVTSVRVGTAAYHHAGATAAQDLAFLIATGLEYLRAARRAGLGPAEAAERFEFSLAVGTGVFLAISKLRAARRLWRRVLDVCQVPAEAGRMRMHVRPSRRVLTTRDPWINMLRNTACVLAAGVAGADSIGAAPFDAALGPPSPLGRRVARNTHHILMEESGIHRVCDPAGGSWYLEHLTDALCGQAWPLVQEIESRGGMAAALSDGWIGAQIDSVFRQRARNLATRRDAVLGVSEFPNLEEQVPEVARLDLAALRSCARARLAHVSRGPDPQAVGQAERMDRLQAAALRGVAMVELTDLLGASPGPVARLAEAVAVHPFAEPFEHLRSASDRLLVECGARPAVHLAPLGEAGGHLPRVNFATNLFEAGGFQVESLPGGADADEEIAAACAARGAQIVVICGSDEVYPERVPSLTRALHGSGVRRVILAGKPGAREEAYRGAGVDDFIYLRCDAVRVLGDLLVEEGATR